VLLTTSLGLSCWEGNLSLDRECFRGSELHGSHAGVLGPELLTQVLVAHHRSSLG